VLDLQNNSLGRDGIKEALMGLEANKGLTMLSLQNNGNDKGPELDPFSGIARAFSGLLHERTALKVLRVGSTGIGDEGAQLIMDALLENDHLEEFEIGFYEIGHIGGEVIADTLKGNKVLKRLRIDGSGIEDDGAAEIAHALQFNTALEELSVQSNNLTPEAAKYFADVLETKATGLRSLSLGYKEHGIAGEWWHHIEALLRCNGDANPVACKEPVIENEEDRVCAVLSLGNFPDTMCRHFLDKGHTRVADLLDMTDEECETLQLGSAWRHRCLKGEIRLAAERVQRHMDEL